MNDDYSLITVHSQLLAENAKQEIRACNAFTEQFGLSLTEDEIRELVECRAAALKNTGRVEFAGGILPKLIYAFCDSPYIDQDNYENVLAQLQEAFYCFKSESMERFRDDELIGYMENVFNGKAQGEVEYLIGISPEDLVQYAQSESDALNTELNALEYERTDQTESRTGQRPSFF